MSSDSFFCPKLGRGKFEIRLLCMKLWVLWRECWSIGRIRFFSLEKVLLFCIVSTVCEKQNVKYGTDCRADCNQ